MIKHDAQSNHITTALHSTIDLLLAPFVAIVCQTDLTIDRGVVLVLNSMNYLVFIHKKAIQNLNFNCYQLSFHVEMKV